MIARARSWLEDVPVAAVAERRVVVTMQLVCLGIAAWAGGSLIVHLWRGAPDGIISVFLVAITATSIVAFGLVRGGRPAVAARVATFGFVAAICLLLGRGLAWGQPFNRLMAIPLAAAALLLGARALWSVYGALAAALCVAALRDQGWLGGTGPEPIAVQPLGAVLSPLVTYFFLTVLLHRFGTELRGALASALRREAEATASAERARALFEASPDAITVTRPDGVYLEVNPGFTRSTGYAPEEVLGRSTAELDLWACRDERAALLARLARGEPLHNVEAHFRHKDGRTAIGLLSVQPVTIDGQGCLLTVARDVTELRRAEAERAALAEQLRQAQRLESIGRLAGGVAHDFNNHLTVILSCVEGLGESAARGEPAEEDDVAHVREAAERARALTRQLLAFARKQTVAPVSLDLRDAVRASERLLRRVVGEDVALRLSLDAATWPVRADPTQLDQILMNLAANARDALPRGGSVELRAANLALRADPRWPGVAPGDWVLLAIQDDGAGMEAEVRDHAFEPFFTTKGLGRGTGLGLATVHGIAAQCGGHARIDSAPGRGTAVELLFPRCLEAPARAAEGSRVAAGSRGETVLLVEDEPAVRGEVVRALQGGGYRVLVAEDGQAALELARGLPAPPDLLLSDVVLPRLDGGAVAVRLRERWPGLRVLFVSGYTADRLAGRGVLRSPRHLLEKPFTRAALLERVRAVLDGPAGLGE